LLHLFTPTQRFPKQWVKRTWHLPANHFTLTVNQEKS